MRYSGGEWENRRALQASDVSRLIENAVALVPDGLAASRQAGSDPLEAATLSVRRSLDSTREQQLTGDVSNNSRVMVVVVAANRRRWLSEIKVVAVSKHVPTWPVWRVASPLSDSRLFAPGPTTGATEAVQALRPEYLERPGISRIWRHHNCYTEGLQCESQHRFEDHCSMILIRE